VALTSLASVAQIAASCTRDVPTSASRFTVTLASGLPLISCLRLSRSRSPHALRPLTIDSEKLVGRGGLQLHLGEVTVCEYALTGKFPVGGAFFGNSEMKPTRRKRQTGQVHPARDSFLQLCAALTLARCLALQQGTSVDFGWPAYWTSDQVSFFLPREEGYTPTRHSVNDVKTCSVWTCTCDEGIQWSTPHWNQFYHVGSVPMPADLRFVFDPSYASVSSTDLVYDPRRDHELGGGWLFIYEDSDLTYGPDHCEERDEATPIPSSVMSVACVAPVFRWLMDTGSDVDLVERAKIAGCEQFVPQNDGITLATANGDLDAKDEIELHVKCIDANIRPLVLEHTPDVQSVGRLCIDDTVFAGTRNHGNHT
jgi:hypothetical protein